MAPDLSQLPPDLQRRMAAAYAAPKTHRVVTLFADGYPPYVHDCRNADIAAGHAAREARKMGRVLKSLRADFSGYDNVRVVAVVTGELS